MKRLRLLAGAGLLSLLAACAASPEETKTDTANVLQEDGLVALPAGTLAAVKAATGHDGAARGRPIYEPGGAAPAFFEVELGDGNGWAVVTAGAAAHVVEFGTSGLGPTARIDANARAAMKKVVRLDAAIYIATDEAGNALGRSTKTLLRIDRSGLFPLWREVSSDEAIKGWQTAQRELTWARARTRNDNAGPPLFGGTPPAKTCSVKGAVPSYSQLSPGEGPNTTSCASGCGPTAWATVFGWGTRRAAEAPTEDGAFLGLFPGAPLTMAPSVGELSMQLNDIVNTICVGDQGATTPWSMANVERFVADRAPGIQIDVHYNFLMVADAGIQAQVIDALCEGRPAIIGIGTLFGGDGHYPIAKGYANGKFELEMGWGGSGNGWYDADTWFIGSVHR